jgi:hypothetical protein
MGFDAAETTTKSISASCLRHYWPVTDNAVEDVIGENSAVPNGWPRFTKNRFGVVNEAIRINDKAHAWRLPQGSYFQSNTTLTMWLRKIKCKEWAPYGT